MSSKMSLEENTDRSTRASRQTRRSHPHIEEESLETQGLPKLQRLSDASKSQLQSLSKGASEEMKDKAKTGDPTDGKGIRTRLSTGTLVMSGTSTTSATVNVDDKPASPTESTSSSSSTAKSSRSADANSGASRKRKRVVDDNEEDSNGDVEDGHTALPPKRKKIGRNDGSGQDNKNDYFCWLCHKEGLVICCELCPRVFHIKCLGREDEPAKDWICPECENVLKAECAETRSKVLTMVSISTFCSLLRFALDRMRSLGNEAFELPVDLSVFSNYRDYVFNPMSLSVLEKNIRKKAYGSTEAFLADAKWIYHNAYVFNGANSKVVTAARSVVKVCKHEMSEIEVCPDCYLQSCTQTDPNWFCEPCRTPHPLVWAKLKGYPYWPAKILREENRMVDVRFFGAHDRSWVSESSCYLLSEACPVVQKKSRAGMDLSLRELDLHIQRWRQKFGIFLYAAPRLVYSKDSVTKHFKRMGLTVEGVATSVESTGQRQEVKKAAGKATDMRAAEKQSAASKKALAVKSKYSSLTTKKTSAKPGAVAAGKSPVSVSSSAPQQRQVYYIKPMQKGVFLLSEQTVERMPQLKSTSGRLPRPNPPDLKLIERIADKINPVSSTSESDTEISESGDKSKKSGQKDVNSNVSNSDPASSGSDVIASGQGGGDSRPAPLLPTSGPGNNGKELNLTSEDISREKSAASDESNLLSGGPDKEKSTLPVGTSQEKISLPGEERTQLMPDQGEAAPLTEGRGDGSSSGTIAGNSSHKADASDAKSGGHEDSSADTGNPSLTVSSGGMDDASSKPTSSESNANTAVASSTGIVSAPDVAASVGGSAIEKLMGTVIDDLVNQPSTEEGDKTLTPNSEAKGGSHSGSLSERSAPLNTEGNSLTSNIEANAGSHSGTLSEHSAPLNTEGNDLASNTQANGGSHLSALPEQSTHRVTSPDPNSKKSEYSGNEQPQRQISISVTADSDAAGKPESVTSKDQTTDSCTTASVTAAAVSKPSETCAPRDKGSGSSEGDITQNLSHAKAAENVEKSDSIGIAHRDDVSSQNSEAASAVGNVKEVSGDSAVCNGNQDSKTESSGGYLNSDRGLEGKSKLSSESVIAESDTVIEPESVTSVSNYASSNKGVAELATAGEQGAKPSSPASSLSCASPAVSVGRPEVSSPLTVSMSDDQVDTVFDKLCTMSKYKEGLQKTIESCKAKLGLNSSALENNDDDDAFMLGMSEDVDDDVDSDALLMDIEDDEDENDGADSVADTKSAVRTEDADQALSGETNCRVVESTPADSSPLEPSPSLSATATLSSTTSVLSTAIPSLSPSNPLSDSSMNIREESSDAVPVTPSSFQSNTGTNEKEKQGEETRSDMEMEAADSAPCAPDTSDKSRANESPSPIPEPKDSSEASSNKDSDVGKVPSESDKTKETSKTIGRESSVEPTETLVEADEISNGETHGESSLVSDTVTQGTESARNIEISAKGKESESMGSKSPSSRATDVSKETDREGAVDEPIITSTDPPPVITIDDENSSDGDDDNEDSSSNAGSINEEDRVSLDMEVTCEDEGRTMETDQGEDDLEDESDKQPDSDQAARSPQSASPSYPNLLQTLTESSRTSGGAAKPPTGKFSMARSLIRPQYEGPTSKSSRPALPSSAAQVMPQPSVSSIPLSSSSITTTTVTTTSRSITLLLPSSTSTPRPPPTSSAMAAPRSLVRPLPSAVAAAAGRILPSSRGEVASCVTSSSSSSPIIVSVASLDSLLNSARDSSRKQVLHPRIEIDRAEEPDENVPTLPPPSSSPVSGLTANASTTVTTTTSGAAVSVAASPAAPGPDPELVRLVNICRTRSETGSSDTASGPGRSSWSTDGASGGEAGGSSRMLEPSLSERLKPVLQRGMKKIMDTLNPCFEELSKEIQRTSSETAGPKDIDEASVLAILEEQKKIYTDKIQAIWKMAYASQKETQELYSKKKDLLEKRLHSEFELLLKKRVEETKRHQWCAECLKEAVYYCCWNTSYCSYQCQQKHWPAHMPKCMQAASSSGAAQSSATLTTSGAIISSLSTASVNISNSNTNAAVATATISGMRATSLLAVRAGEAPSSKTKSLLRFRDLQGHEGCCHSLGSISADDLSSRTLTKRPQGGPAVVSSQGVQLSQPPSSMTFAPNQTTAFHYLPQTGTGRPVIMANPPAGSVLPQQVQLLPSSAGVLPMMRQQQPTAQVRLGQQQTSALQQTQRYILNNTAFGFNLLRPSRPL